MVAAFRCGVGSRKFPVAVDTTCAFTTAIKGIVQDSIYPCCPMLGEGKDIPAFLGKFIGTKMHLATSSNTHERCPLGTEAFHNFLVGGLVYSRSCRGDATFARPSTFAFGEFIDEFVDLWVGDSGCNRDCTTDTITCVSLITCQWSSSVIILEWCIHHLKYLKDFRESQENNSNQNKIFPKPNNGSRVSVRLK